MFFFIVGAILLAYVLDKAIRSLKVGGFNQKYVLITGCDSGFGQKLALRLDGLGFPVFAACLTKEGEHFLSENASSRLNTLTLNVTDSSSIHRAFESVAAKLPQGIGLWAIVNNAGIGGPLLFTEMVDMEGFHKTFHVNLFGAVEMCRAFLPLVRKEKGRIVNMASVMGRFAGITSAYSASKFAIEGFSDALRRELYPQGIKVSILEPGVFKTNIIAKESMKKSIMESYKHVDEEVKTAYGASYLEATLSLIDRVDKNANPNTDLVVDAYVHALVSKYPRTRYVIGWDAKLLFVPLSWLPGGVADWILRTMRSLAKKNKEN